MDKNVLALAQPGNKQRGDVNPVIEVNPAPGVALIFYQARRRHLYKTFRAFKK
jgi:hypothetical protein